MSAKVDIRFEAKSWTQTSLLFPDHSSSTYITSSITRGVIRAGDWLGVGPRLSTNTMHVPWELVPPPPLPPLLDGATRTAAAQYEDDEQEEGNDTSTCRSAD